MLNYFNFFTEIEHRFQQRRGSLLMLSTLDWALIETWRDAGIPLEAVLRGIDTAFDRHDAKHARNPRTRKVNGLAWCSQAVAEAAEQAAEATTGTLIPGAVEAAATGFEPTPVAAYLNRNAAKVAAATLPGIAAEVAATTAARLRDLAGTLTPTTPLESLDRNLAILEEKLLNALQIAAPEEDLLRLREQAARELAPYRGKMQAVQIKQVQAQFLHKRLFEAYALPRLSLFYMSAA